MKIDSNYASYFNFSFHFYRVARSVLAFEKFGTEMSESMQFSHKSNVNF
jgi:hypothetical protein